MPELKKFLVTNKEADQYEKLTVKFIPGRKAILTILDDGKETEKIVLSDYNDREKMHALLAEKGFKRKSSEELRKLEAARRQVAEGQAAAQQAREEQKARGVIGR